MRRKASPTKKQSVENRHLAVLRKRVATAPQSPGVYRWLDEHGTVLYVGKAKNLRNRLRSYVTKDTAAGPWKKSFREQIADFEVTVTNTELEALIFETNQIKDLRPKYNVLMKDDKNYIYARITVDDPYPIVESSRRVLDDGAQYFGPMVSGGELWMMLTMLRSVFPFRTCRMGIVAKEGASGIPLEVECTHKDRPTPCLDHHIEKCLAPCIGAVTPERYRSACIDGVIRFLKGDYDSVRPVFEERMRRAAAEKKFELAGQFRDYLASLDRLQGKQLITDTSGEDSDIIAVAVLSGRADVVVMHRRGGRLIGDVSFSLAGQAEDATDVLAQFLPQYYGGGNDIPETIIVSQHITDAELLQEWLSGKKGRNVRILLPQRGKKSHLLQLAEKNVLEKSRQRELKWESEQRNTEAALRELQEALGLPEIPQRIEGYDISHLGGTETVGSMVVARNGKAANDHYRSFTIRSLKSGEVDDYRSLREVLRRRLRRLVENLEEEEREWKAKDVAFGKPRKAELGALTDEEEKKDAKEWLIAREGTKIVGSIRLRPLAGLRVLESFWTDPAHRGERLGQFLLRKMLRSVKKGKIYIVCKPELEEYYAEVGFRHVVKAPPALEEKLGNGTAEHPLEAFLWDAAQNKIDPSLSMRPDLLVIDGGKGQLSAVKEVLDSLHLSIPVIGLAKREEEVFLPGESESVLFAKDAPGKFLLMRLRDEAHRFANRLREKKGAKSAKTSALDAIPGIGPETRKALQKKFGSVASVREATDEELLGILSQTQLRELRRRL